MSKVKNLVHGTDCRLESGRNKIGELEDIAIEKIQTETQREKSK